MGLASLVVTYSVLGVTAGWSPASMAIALVVATIATLLETLSFYGLDNLTVPLVSGLLAYGLGTWLL
jgi:phytol kinase